MDVDDIPWPVAGEPLIRDDLPDWHNNACLDPFDPDMGRYAEGYRQGAGQLVALVTSGQGTVDFLIYPIVFLYRHSVEVALKDLIRSGNRWLDVPNDFQSHHMIDRLWGLCRRILQQIENDKPVLDAVEEKVLALHELDPDSFHFRYPADKQGKQLPPKTMVRMNVRHFAEQMEQVASFLRAAVNMIEVHLDCKRDMEEAY